MNRIELRLNHFVLLIPFPFTKCGMCYVHLVIEHYWNNRIFVHLNLELHRRICYMFAWIYIMMVFIALFSSRNLQCHHIMQSANTKRIPLHRFERGNSFWYEVFLSCMNFNPVPRARIKFFAARRISGEFAMHSNFNYINKMVQMLV